MHIVSKALLVPGLVIFISGCSDPELFNPNDPKDPNYVNAGELASKVQICTVPAGIQFNLPNTYQNVTGYQVEKFQNGIAGELIQITSSQDESYLFIDSTIAWLDTCQYIVKAKTASGLTPALADTVIAFQISGGMTISGTISDSTTNQAVLVYPISMSDRSIITGGALQLASDTSQTQIGTRNGDLLSFVLHDLPWGDTLQYKLKLNAGGNDTIFDTSIEFPIAHFPLTAKLQFMGNGDIGLTIDHGSRETPNSSTIYIHPDLIDAYYITYESSTIEPGNQSFPSTTIIHAPVNIYPEINLQNLVVHLFRDTFRFDIPVAADSLENPPEIDFMRLVEPGNTSVYPFFIDKYEITVAEWLARTGSSPTWMDTLMPGIAEHVKPVGFVGKVRVENYLASDSTLRQLPSLAQWQAAGGATNYSNGYDIITPEVANTYQSNDNFEQNTAFPAVPVDFFEDVNNPGYTVNGNPPASDLNPFSVYQLTGNLFEWVVDSQDTTIVGGSFWSSLPDSLLRRDSFLNPSEVIPYDRAEYGLRTVLKESPNAQRYHNIYHF